MNKQNISFRPKKDELIGERFWSAVEALGVRESDLARRIFEIGLEPAARQIAKEQRERVAKLKGRLDFNPPYNARAALLAA